VLFKQLEAKSGGESSIAPMARLDRIWSDDAARSQHLAIIRALFAANLLSGQRDVWAGDCTSQDCSERRAIKMLWTICVILFVLWALGMVTSYTAGGLLHILLVVALAILVFNLIMGRRASI